MSGYCVVFSVAKSYNISLRREDCTLLPETTLDHPRSSFDHPRSSLSLKVEISGGGERRGERRGGKRRGEGERQRESEKEKDTERQRQGLIRMRRGIKESFENIT